MPVDGRVVKDPLRRVPLDRARVTVDAAAVAPRPFRLLAFHKPRGTVTTRSDPEERPTVFDLLGSAADGLIAVGRLDRASTGLLLLTTDSYLVNSLTDPVNRITRRYVVTVRGRVTPDEARRLEGGIETLRASKVTIRKASGRETHLIVELVEGKNREVRRLFEAIGHEVTRVHRIAFGDYALGDLQPGRWREIAPVT